MPLKALRPEILEGNVVCMLIEFMQVKDDMMMFASKAIKGCLVCDNAVVKIKATCQNREMYGTEVLAGDRLMHSQPHGASRKWRCYMHTHIIRRMHES